MPYTLRPEPIQPPPGAMHPAIMQQQGRGSCFLGTALTTAAGVAGGMVLGNALMGMLSGDTAEAATAAAGAVSNAAGAAMGAVGSFAEQAVSTPASSAWTDAAGDDASGFEDEDTRTDVGRASCPARRMERRASRKRRHPPTWGACRSVW
ncbi:DUF2076 domain-containing protein [Muricoccus vinaceus]|uniref:DUF2076 domain-containing protein n=1 Tax=Muricoccus vinaceus TaxID=424704 RepID=A0ABV6IQB3_9PROT